MKRYVEVYWAPWNYRQDPDLITFASLDAITTKPKPILTVLGEERKNARYLQCPAVTDLLKNTFVVEASFDLNMVFNTQDGTACTDRYGQEFFDKFILFRANENGSNNRVLATVPPRYIFYAHESVTMQTSDLPIITSKSSVNTRVVPGAYDIGKWVRTVDWTFEIPEGNELHMCRGDYLYAIRFTTKNDLPVKLVRVDLTKDLIRAAEACSQVKLYIPKLKLAEAYETVKEFLQVWRNK